MAKLNHVLVTKKFRRIVCFFTTSRVVMVKKLTKKLKRHEAAALAFEFLCDTALNLDRSQLSD